MRRIKLHDAQICLSVVGRKHADMLHVADGPTQYFHDLPKFFGV